MSNVGLAAQKDEEVLISVRPTHRDATNVVPPDRHFGILPATGIKIDPRKLDPVSVYSFDSSNQTYFSITKREECVPLEAHLGAFYRGLVQSLRGPFHRVAILTLVRARDRNTAADRGFESRMRYQTPN